MDRVKLKVSVREGRGSKDAKALRASGEIPGVIYSATTDTQAITVNARALRQAVAGGLHTILDVTLEGDGKGRPVLIKDLQLDPVRGRVVHIDLHEIRLDQKIQTVIPVHLEGHAEGVNMGGALNQPVHEVHVEALPADLIDFISVDVSALEIGQSVRLSDIVAPSGVTFTDDPESTVLASIAAPVSEEDLKSEAELEAGEGGEEAGGEEPSGDESSE
jgi:large subunit ribosomal protein L25